jgi:hypothetical protein
VPPDSVRCPGPYDFKLATFGFQKSRFTIIHHTVRCATRLSGVPAGNDSSVKIDCNGHLQKCYSAQTVRAESEQPSEGAPDSEQCLFGAAPDCPVPQEVKAPMIETVRTLTVG